MSVEGIRLVEVTLLIFLRPVAVEFSLFCFSAIQSSERSGFFRSDGRAYGNGSGIQTEISFLTGRPLTIGQRSKREYDLEGSH